MNDKIIIAIDPGKNGAIAVKIADTIEAYDMPSTPTDIYDLLKEYSSVFIQLYDNIPVCYLERVHGRPGMGGAAMFTFGCGYGYLEMALLALKIPTISITPQKWMKSIEMGVRGSQTATQWKNKLKARAQQLYPNIKVTLKNADALLILHYAIQNQNG